MLLESEWIVASELGQERIVLDGLTQVLAQAGLDEPRLEEIVTAVSEACLNAIEHGNRFVSALPVTATMRVSRERYTFRIRDCGTGTDPEAAGEPMSVRGKIAWEQPRGWGLQLMRAYADKVTATRENGGFCLELQFWRHCDGGSYDCGEEERQ